MCLQYLRIWGWTIAIAGEKKNILQPLNSPAHPLFESRNKIFQSHHHKKVSCKTFYLFLSSTMCYSLRRTWRHLQVGAMVAGTVCAHVKKKLGGGEWRGWRGQHVQTDTPLQFMWQFYVIFLTCCKESHSCHFDWPIKHSNLWSWSCQSSYDFRLLLSPHGHNKQSLDYFGVGYCNSPPHEVLMISRFFAQFLTRVQLSKFYLSAGYPNQMKIFSLQNKETF